LGRSWLHVDHDTVESAAYHRGWRTATLYRIAPGLGLVTAYQRDWFRHDLIAGVSVAAVALPTAIAYAQLIGLEPVTGLYAAIPALLAYALFGTSRHLIVNPDAATCAMIGATLAPLARRRCGGLVVPVRRLGRLCRPVLLYGRLLRLGFLADFLSRPILVGFLNGVAISIFLGQIGKVFGFPMESHGIIASFVEFVGKIPETHWPTLAVGLLTIAVMLVSKRLLPRWPGPLLAVVAAVAAVKILGLEAAGVAVVGDVPAGLPRLRWPTCDPQFLQPLFGGALGVALVSFCNAMVVARSFAAKNDYEVDADRELFALGASQLAAGLCQGFAVSGTESRTAMNHAMGGKSQVAGLVAAAVMAAVLLFLTGPLSYLPIAALGGVLIVAAIGLFDVASLRRLWRVSRAEFSVAVVTMLGVIALDVLAGNPAGGRCRLAPAAETQRAPARRGRGPRAGDERLPRPCPPSGRHDDAGVAAVPVRRRARLLQRDLLPQSRPGVGRCPSRPETSRHRRQHHQHHRQHRRRHPGRPGPRSVPPRRAARPGRVPDRDQKSARTHRRDRDHRRRFRLRNAEGSDDCLPSRSLAPSVEPATET
jgi:high affinity sulfate transporter 1